MTKFPTNPFSEVRSITWPFVPGPSNVPKIIPPLYSVCVVVGRWSPTQIFIFLVLSPQQSPLFVILTFWTFDRGISTATHGQLSPPFVAQIVTKLLSWHKEPGNATNPWWFPFHTDDILISTGVIPGAGTPKTSISAKLILDVAIWTMTKFPTNPFSEVRSITWPFVPGPSNVPKIIPPLYSVCVVVGRWSPTQIFIFLVLSPQQSPLFVILTFWTFDRGISTATHGQLSPPFVAQIVTKLLSWHKEPGNATNPWWFPFHTDDIFISNRVIPQLYISLTSLISNSLTPILCPMNFCFSGSFVMIVFLLFLLKALAP